MKTAKLRMRGFRIDWLPHTRFEDAAEHLGQMFPSPIIPGDLQVGQGRAKTHRGADWNADLNVTLVHEPADLPLPDVLEWLYARANHEICGEHGQHIIGVEVT